MSLGGARKPYAFVVVPTWPRVCPRSKSNQNQKSYACVVFWAEPVNIRTCSPRTVKHGRYPGALRVSAASRDHRGGRTAKSRLPARPSQSGGPHDLSPQERTQVRRLRTRLSSDDCYDYTFIFVMLLHLTLIISLNIECAPNKAMAHPASKLYGAATCINHLPS